MKLFDEKDIVTAFGAGVMIGALVVYFLNLWS